MRRVNAGGVGGLVVRALCSRTSAYVHLSKERARPFLERFKYAPNAMYLHSDPRCVPGFSLDHAC